MKKTKYPYKSLYICLLIALSAGITSCRDDVDENASVVGKWQGNKSEVKAIVALIPVYTKTDDTFNPTLEFKTDGTGTILIDGSQSSGTWEWINVNKTLKTSIDFKTPYLESTETYTVKELTATTLTLSIERDGTFTDPDSGESFNGTIRAILYFDRISQ